MPYVDGFVLAIPADKKEAYLTNERRFGLIFKEYGALQVVTTWGDDVPDGKVTSFPMAVKLEEGEVVGLSWVYWPDKATRDAGNAAFMADPRVAEFDFSTMVFDGKRMIFGGFNVEIEV